MKLLLTEENHIHIIWKNLFQTFYNVLMPDIEPGNSLIASLRC